MTGVTDARFRLLDNGWRPVPIVPFDLSRDGRVDRSAGKRPTINDWTQYCDAAPTEGDIENWGKDPRYSVDRQNTGLALTPGLVAIDLDYTDPDLAAKAEAITVETLGYSPLRRVGRAPKVAFLYRLETPVANIARKLADGSGQGVDILTHGKQIVVLGTHPDTHKPYAWTDQSPLDEAADGIPLIKGPVEAIERLLQRLGELAPFGDRRNPNGRVEAIKTPLAADGAGRITDGREGLLRDIVMRQASRFFDDFGAPPTEDDLTATTWSEFSKVAAVGDGKWGEADARIKANALIRRANAGHIKLGRPVAYPVEPFHALKHVPVEEARITTQNLVDQFLGQAKEFQDDHGAWWERVAPWRIAMTAWRQRKSQAKQAKGHFYEQAPTCPEPEPVPEVWGGRIGTGVGKTTTHIFQSIDAIAAGTLTGGILTLPAHKSCDEKVEIARDYAASKGYDVSVDTWYGRAWPSPDDPERSVCDQTELWTEITGAGGDPSELCKTCKFATSCYALKQQTKKARLWIVPTALVANAMPKQIKADTQFLAIDEDLASYLVWGTSTRGDESSKPTWVPLSLVEREWTGPSKSQAEFLANALVSVRGALGESVGRPYLNMDELALSGDELAEAGRILWQAKREIKIDTETTVDKVRSLEAGRWNRELRKLAALLKALETAKRQGWKSAGRISVSIETNEDAGDFTAARVSGMRELASGWAALPILRLDATLNEAIERQIFPNIKLVQAVEADARDQHVIMVPMSASKASVTETDGISDKERVTRRNRLGAVANLIEVLDRETDKGVLAITYKDAAAGLRKMPLIPERATIWHFKAQRGMDGAKDVGAAVIYGSTRPNEDAIARTTAAIFGEAFDRSTKYRWKRRGFNMRDGSLAGIDVEVHPDPQCDQVLQWICDAELVQSIGRVRGVNRSPGTPVTVFVCSNRVLPIEVAAVREWKDILPSRLDLAMSREGGVLALNSTTLAARNPGLWATKEAAKAEVKRGQTKGVKLLYRLPIGERPLSLSTQNGTVKRGSAPGRASRFVAMCDLSSVEIRDGLRRQLGGDLAVRFGLSTVPDSESDESSAAGTPGIRQADYDSAALGTEPASSPPDCPPGSMPDDAQPAALTLDDNAPPPENQADGGWGQGGFGAGPWGGNVEQLPTLEAVYRVVQDLYVSYYMLAVHLRPPDPDVPHRQWDKQ